MSQNSQQLAFDQLAQYQQIKPANPNQTATNKERVNLHYWYADKLVINPELNRSLVSFQANRSTPFYRWFKYREGFSSELVKYFFNKLRPSVDQPLRVLDPFAGAGTTLTTVTKEGCQATGIELLPVGVAAIRARLVADTVSIDTFQQHLKRLTDFPLNSSTSSDYRFPHIRITENAFPEETEHAISAYMAFLDEITDVDVRYLFWFACFSILEDISYTRKDGQYLRWDNRSGRQLKATFNKGVIQDFRTAILNKLQIMIADIKKRNDGTFSRQVRIIHGTCLDSLQTFEEAAIDLIITSPPYCNRYDYTRTYALELAFMNHGEDDIKRLRQTLLSATVENKSKRDWLVQTYRERQNEGRFSTAAGAFANQAALQEVLDLLYSARERGELNNPKIPDLVANYFFEMSFVIHELARTLAPSGRIIMVNDNVQYQGEEIPVDLILSDFATTAGLSVDYIWVLPRGKGNSSQQMGIHGRNEIRKGVYVWSKPV